MKVPPFLSRLGYALVFGLLMVAIISASVWAYHLATTPKIVLAQELLDAGKPHRAIGLLENFLEKSPDHADVIRGRELLAQTLLNQLNEKEHWPENALDEIWHLLPQEVSSWSPESQEIALGVARAHNQEQRLRLAENAYRTLLQKGGSAALGRVLAELIMRRNPDNVNDALQWLDRAMSQTEDPSEKATFLLQKGQHQADAWLHKVFIDKSKRSVIPFSQLEALLKPAAPLRNSAHQSLKSYLALDKKTTTVPGRVQAHLLSTRIFIRQASNEQILLDRNLSQHNPSDSNTASKRESIRKILERGLSQMDRLLADRIEIRDRQQALLLRGDIQGRLGNHAASEKSFAKILDLVENQNDAPLEIKLAYLKALIGRSQVEISEGKLTEARATMDRIESTSPLPATISYLLAQKVQDLLTRTVQQINHKAASTISRLETLRRPHSEIVQIREQAAQNTQTQTLSLRKRAARLFWKATLDADPADEHLMRRDAAWEAANLYRAMGQYAHEKQSIDRFLDAIETDGRISEAYYRAGIACQNLGLLQESEGFHNQNIEAFPEAPWSHRSRLARGQVFARAGNSDQAIRTYQEILDSPNFSPRSDIWRESLFALAELRFQQVLGPPPAEPSANNPDSPKSESQPQPPAPSSSTTDQMEMYIQLATQLHNEFLGRYGPSKLVPGPVDPRSTLCLFRLGVLALMQNKSEKALEHFESIERSSGDSNNRIVITTSYLLGDVQMRLARKESDPAKQKSMYQAALQNYEKATRRFPDAHQARAWAYYRMGRILKSLNRPDQGRRYQELSLALYSDLTQKKPTTTDPFGPDYWLEFIRWTESKRS